MESNRPTEVQTLLENTQEKQKQVLQEVFNQVQSDITLVRNRLDNAEKSINQIKDTVNKYPQQKDDLTNYKDNLKQNIKIFFDAILTYEPNEKINADKDQFLKKIDNATTKKDIEKINNNLLKNYLPKTEQTIKEINHTLDSMTTAEGFEKSLQGKKNKKQQLNEIRNNPFGLALTAMALPVLLPLAVSALGLALAGAISLISLAAVASPVIAIVLGTRDVIKKSVDTVKNAFQKAGLWFDSKLLNYKINNTKAVLEATSQNMKTHSDSLETTLRGANEEVENITLKDLTSPNNITVDNLRKDFGNDIVNHLQDKLGVKKDAELEGKLNNVTIKELSESCGKSTAETISKLTNCIAKNNLSNNLQNANGEKKTLSSKEKQQIQNKSVADAVDNTINNISNKAQNLRDHKDQMNKDLTGYVKNDQRCQKHSEMFNNMCQISAEIKEKKEAIKTHTSKSTLKSTVKYLGNQLTKAGLRKETGNAKQSYDTKDTEKNTERSR